VNQRVIRKEHQAKVLILGRSPTLLDMPEYKASNSRAVHQRRIITNHHTGRIK
jgi:hypothetical protein